MKAIVVQADQGNPVLVWQDVADVEFSQDEVLVAVKATAVNRADLLQAIGAYPPPPGASEILGLEMAGVIEAVGDGVVDWQVGDRVCALLPGGGYAEKAAVPADMLMRLPDDWTFTASGPPLTSFRSGIHSIPREDFRLMDALSMVGGLPEDTQTIFVIRQKAVKVVE